MEILGKLFGSESRVKIIRLFLFNPAQVFSVAEIAERGKIPPALARREVRMFRKIGLAKTRTSTKLIRKQVGKRLVLKRRKDNGYALNESFAYLAPLRELLINTVLFKNDALIQKLQSTGRIKLLIVAGVFIHDEESRVDLLIVGEGIKKFMLENVMRTIEAEIGKELRYAAFETIDFHYRFGMYDKLIRDILDYPHRKILNKLGFVYPEEGKRVEL